MALAFLVAIFGLPFSTFFLQQTYVSFNQARQVVNIKKQVDLQIPNGSDKAQVLHYLKKYQIEYVEWDKRGKASHQRGNTIYGCIYHTTSNWFGPADILLTFQFDKNDKSTNSTVESRVVNF